MTAMKEPSGQSKRLEPSRSVVVYDGKTGKIVHVHHFAAAPGTDLPPKEKLSEIAMQLAARKSGGEASSLKVLEVEASAIRPKTTYRVSPDGKLVEQPVAKHPGPRL
jgi:hypothetical protein